MKGLLKPARCPRGARMGCSSPHSVPPERSKGLLEPPLGAPRALEGTAQACSVPQDAPSGCSSLCSVPYHALAAWALENTAPTMLWPRGRPKTLHIPCPTRCPQSARRSCSSPRSVPHSARSACFSPCSVPQEHSKWLLEPLLGAPGALKVAIQAPARCHRRRRACFCVTGRSKRRSRKLFEESVPCCTTLCAT